MKKKCGRKNDLIGVGHRVGGRVSNYSFCSSSNKRCTTNSFKNYFKKMKRARYLETLALMFNITLPSLTTFSVTKKWSRLGHFPLSLERTLLLCKEIIPNDTVDKVKANLRTWVDECVKTGTLSDKSMSAALGSIGGVFILAQSDTVS